MTLTTLNLILGLCALLVAIPFAFGLWKRNFIAYTVVVNRQTDDGEQLTIQAAIPTKLTHDQRHEVIQTLMDHGDRRKWFTDDRFKKRIQEEMAKNEKGALHSV